MNIKEVKDLIHEILHSDISEFELEHTGTWVKLKRGPYGNSGAVNLSSPASISIGAIPSRPSGVETTFLPSDHADESEDDNIHIIISPIVGTFYRASNPNAEPFVRVGGHVEAGSILCIVEAMKLMNEIPSDVSGEIMRIYVENGHPVEFGQKLFGIRLNK
jgi:acetyl-CoA carboxylase biotin carboxyl carrier protein